MGSQVFTVRRIRRAGDRPSAPPPSAPGRAPPAQLARIAVVKRAPTEPGDRSVDAALASDTTLRQELRFATSPASCVLLADAAAHAIASGRVDRAERILEAALLEILAAQRSGASREVAIVDFALAQALALCEACEGRRRLRWIDYVHDFYDARRTPIPLEVADRLARAMQLAGP
jgi:hypothetical protein